MSDQLKPSGSMGSERSGIKAFTPDLRSPIQGGNGPVWDGSLPFTLPRVTVDRSERECGSGWNFGRDLAKLIRLVGLWPLGRPTRFYAIEVPETIEVYHRGEKSRCAVLTIVRELTDDEVAVGIRDFSQVFGTHADAMAEEQVAWRKALARPHRDADAVRLGLGAALEARNLPWTLKEFTSHMEVADARDAWDARVARVARDAWDAWDARDAWVARVAWDAWVAWVALDARAALTVSFAARQQWTPNNTNPDLLTTGIRDAYLNGLGIALPTGPLELGWSMENAR